MPVIAAPTSHTHELGTTRFTALVTPSRGSTETSLWEVQIEPGTPATPHELTREELFVVLAGRAAVRIGDERLQASVGDVIVVPADTPFEITNPSDEPLRALCCLPVGGQGRVSGGEPFTPPWAE